MEISFVTFGIVATIVIILKNQLTFITIFFKTGPSDIKDGSS